MGLLFLMVVSCASATVINYNIGIVFNFGPLNGQTGSGSLSLDDSLVQHGTSFDFVAPNGLGLLALQIAAVGQTLDMTTSVSYPLMPTLYVDANNVPTFLWAGWGSTTSTNDVGYILGGNLEYDTSANSLQVSRFNAGNAFETWHYGPNNQLSSAELTFTQTPEPGSGLLMSLAAAATLAFRRRLH